MKNHLLPLAFILALASCDQETSSTSEISSGAGAKALTADSASGAGNGLPGKSGPRPESKAKVRELLARQELGGKLLGNTVRLVGDHYEQVDLDYVPDYYLLYHTASWCGPCRAAAPKFVEHYNDDLADRKDLALIQVSMDSDTKSAEKWAKKDKFPWLTMPREQQESSGFDEYAVTAIPSYILHDADGKIIARGKDQVLAAIKELE